MRRRLAIAALLAGWPAIAGDVRDPQAVKIANEMMEAMGGESAWRDARFVRFDFVVLAKGKTVLHRKHFWHKATGAYRIDSQTWDGKPSVVLFNVATRKGKAYIGGKEVIGGDAEAQLKDSYAAFLHDMYRLAMPWKWLDQGVSLKYKGTKRVAGMIYDLVELTFAPGAGLTPGDKYLAYVQRKSKLMDRWQYTLESGRTGDWTWSYTTSGGVMLASTHKSTDGSLIAMGPVAVTATADESLFRDPSKALQ